MRKGVTYLFFAVLLTIILACLGYYIFRITQVEEKEPQIEIAVQKVEDECTKEAEQLETENQIIMTSGEEKKVSPNAVLILKKYYKTCKHTTKSYVEIPNEIVNLTQKEVNEFYKDWEVVGFSPSEIVLQREIDGNCNEHYALRERNGFIAIYKIDERGIETLEEMTQISTEYLTESDLKELKEGIKIYGKENLNATIEDYE